MWFCKLFCNSSMFFFYLPFTFQTRARSAFQVQKTFGLGVKTKGRSGKQKQIYFFRPYQLTYLALLSHINLDLKIMPAKYILLKFIRPKPCQLHLFIVFIRSLCLFSKSIYPDATVVTTTFAFTFFHVVYWMILTKL